MIISSFIQSQQVLSPKAAQSGSSEHSSVRTHGCSSPGSLLVGLRHPSSSPLKLLFFLYCRRIFLHNCLSLCCCSPGKLMLHPSLTARQWGIERVPFFLSPNKYLHGVHFYSFLLEACNNAYLCATRLRRWHHQSSREINPLPLRHFFKVFSLSAAHLEDYFSLKALIKIFVRWFEGYISAISLLHNQQTQMFPAGWAAGHKICFQSFMYSWTRTHTEPLTWITMGTRNPAGI